MSIGPIHHVAIVVRSIEESLPRYLELFGLEPEAPPMTFAPQRVRLCFLPTGPEPSARLELVEPIDDDSGVARYLASHGEGIHHLCFLTDDLPASLEALAAAEAELIDREPRPGAHGTVAFVHPRTLSGVLWELLRPYSAKVHDFGKETTPRLCQFFGGYFNKNWNVDYGTVENAVSSFVADSPVDDIEAVLRDLESLIAADLDEQELQVAMENVWCEYWPHGAGSTYRDWLPQLRDDIAGALRKRG